MSKLTYVSLLNKTLELYKEEKYQEAYDFITRNFINVKGNDAQIYNFRYSLATKAGNEDLALRILSEAVKEKGYWYSYEYLMSDDDLVPLYDKDIFKEVAEICKQREIKAHEVQKPRIKIIEPIIAKHDKKLPLVIALHGNQENIEIAEEHWNTEVFYDSVIALPESSQIEFASGYVWEDIKKGSDELKVHYDEICQTFNIDEGDVMIGAFSAGASVAIDAILDGKIPAKRFLFIAPWLPNLDDIKEKIIRLKEIGLRGYLICGDADKDCFECTKKFAQMLNDEGITYRLTVIEGLDHEYPDNFNNLLRIVNCYFEQK